VTDIDDFARGQRANPLGEVARLFVTLGAIGFGGPAAHIALMRDEVVRRRGWIDDDEFLDLVGATNLIPGPNSTELAIHLGHRRAGWSGLVTAGVCFIAPAVVIVVVRAYVTWAPGVAGILYGIVPAVIAIIAHALVGLFRTAVKNVWLGGLALGALAAYLLGANELLVLASGAVLAAGIHAVRHAPRRGSHGLFVAPLVLAEGQPLFPDPTGGQLLQLFATMQNWCRVCSGAACCWRSARVRRRLGWIASSSSTLSLSVR
jgi:chromate transporter